MHIKDVPDLNARQLLAVVTLAERGSFTTAAAALEVSQPALSRTLQRVEQVLGVKLFARNTRRLEITAAGRDVVSAAERMLADLQLALHNVGEVGAEQKGQVVVSTFPIFAHDMLPKIVRRFRETRPGVLVRVRHGCNTEIVEEVSTGVSDFGIAYVNSLPDTIDCTHVRHDPLYLILPWSHPLAKSKETSIKFTDLRELDFISLGHNSHTQRLIDGAAAKAGFTLRSVVVTAGFQDIMQHVRAGVGVGVLPGEALPKRRDFAVRLLKAPSLSMSIGVIALRSRHLTPAATRLMKMALEYLQSSGTGAASGGPRRAA